MPSTGSSPLIPPDPRDREWMGRALAAARTAGEAGEVPIGAVLIGPDGRVRAVAGNDRETSGDPTGHAEVRVIREAATALGARFLDGCTLVVTLEPCAMCAGTILAARIPRVVFGAWDAKAGAVGSVYDLLRDGRLPHPVPEVIGGVREGECAQLLAEFFAASRSRA